MGRGSETCCGTVSTKALSALSCAAERFEPIRTCRRGRPFQPSNPQLALVATIDALDNPHGIRLDRPCFASRDIGYNFMAS